MEGPAGPLHAAGEYIGGVRTLCQVHHVFLEQQGGCFLDGVVVPVAHLGLSVFERAFARRPAGEEQVGPGMADGFHPGLQAQVLAGLSGRCALQRDGLLQPQLGQGGELQLVAQARRAGDRLDAGRRRCRAFALVQAGDADRLGGVGTELAAGEDVTALQGDVLAGRHRFQRHCRLEFAQDRAAAQRGDQQAGGKQAVRERHGRAVSWMPGTPARMACGKSAGGPVNARARLLMRPAACSCA